MRYPLATLLVFAMMPVLNVLAAPAPDPSAILDIGPPPKGETAEQYRKDQIKGKTSHGTLGLVWSDPEVRKLPSVAHFQDARPWLAENLRVTAEEGGRRLRFTFRAGTRAEQVNIINAFLRASLSWQDEGIKCDEEWIRVHEKQILELQTRIKSTQDPREIASHQKGIKNLRTNLIAACRDDIARRKQYSVIRWAR